jgi:hypothetical protein
MPAFGVAFGWIRRRPDGQGNPCKPQIVSDRLVVATDGIPSSGSALTAHRLSPPAFSVKSLPLAGVR